MNKRKPFIQAGFLNRLRKRVDGLEFDIRVAKAELARERARLLSLTRTASGYIYECGAVKLRAEKVDGREWHLQLIANENCKDSWFFGSLEECRRSIAARLEDSFFCDGYVIPIGGV